jgi:MFS family permease
MTAQETATGTRTGKPNRWLILALGLASQTSASSFIYGIPFLVPAIRSAENLSLAQVGVVVAAPTFGLLLTLIAWGALADRYGERIVMAIGIGGCGLLVAAAGLLVHGLTGFVLLLGLAGAGGASVNAASGRVVLGWFAPAERGRAMSVRQLAQPIGLGIASFALPLLAEHFGFRAALLLPAVLCLACSALVFTFVVDPPRPDRAPGERPRSPYRTPVLWRLHGASTLLVIPQFTISVFALEYLVTQQHWTPTGAGVFLAVVQVFGGLGRLATGYWSDKVGSRLRPMRWLAVASAAVMLLAALGDLTWEWLIVLALVAGSIITVADNGLGFTSTAELAGSAWAGRALGAQNTAQNIASTLLPPVLGLTIGATNYAVAFAAVAIFPILAIFVTPVAAETGSTARNGSTGPT